MQIVPSHVLCCVAGKFKGYSGEDQQLSLEDLISLLQSVDHEREVDSSDAIISDKALEALLDRSVSQPGEGEREGERQSKEIEGVFKVIHEQDSSGKTLPSINNSTASDTENQPPTPAEDQAREKGGREGEEKIVPHEQDSIGKILPRIDSAASEAENQPPPPATDNSSEFCSTDNSETATSPQS